MNYDNEGLTVLVKRIGSKYPKVNFLMLCIGLFIYFLLFTEITEIPDNLKLSLVGVFGLLIFPTYAKIIYCGVAGFSLFDRLNWLPQFLVNGITYFILICSLTFPFSVLLNLLE